MPGIGPSKQVLEGEVLSGATPACAELAPISPSARFAPQRPAARPDTSFVTHLIATVMMAPQTRSLRRGTPADAQIAYAGRPQERRGVTRRTRQVV
jgi:hypothetical protein